MNQAQRAWYPCIEIYFVRNEFQRCPYEHTLNVKSNFQGDVLIVCLHVDDLIMIGTNLEMIVEFKELKIG